MMEVRACTYAFTAARALVISVVLTAPVQAAVEDDIFAIIESAHQGDSGYVMPEPLRAVGVLGEFYAAREYAPAWQSYDFVAEVLAELAAAREEGLNPEDYHYSTLQALAEKYRASGKKDELVRAQFDVLMSDAVLLYARHLQEGKIDPAAIEPTWNFGRRDFDAQRVSQVFTQALVDGNVVEILQGFKPPVRFYGLLKEELARYREITESHVFQLVPDDTVLRPAMVHPNVVDLRRQLKQLGLLAQDSASPALFDEQLEQAVRRFQEKHALDADGVVGRASFAALNVPYQNRVDQLRLNLERVRWIQDDLSGHMVVVNIAGYELYYFRDQELTWQTDVMVGTIRTQTPIFHANMTYLVLNPTWTVPRSIIRKSLFRKFQNDPNYVSDHNYKLYDSDGVEADPATMDWSSYSAGRFPYRVVQQPGDGNAMGRVKFMFPNKYAIYLHDTPSLSLFAQTDRAFSHGCIRVQDPLQFAEMLLQDNSGWSREKIDQTLEVPEQKVVKFESPVAVILMYWTASPNLGGGVTLNSDVYKKDPETLALLDQTPSWDAL